jgi:hypothetical protein
MVRVHSIGLAALAVTLPLAAVSSVGLAATTSADVGWRPIDCSRSQLELLGWMQCRISTDDTVERNLKGTARHYVTLGGTNAAAAGMVLSVPQDDGYFAAYPPSESEMAIRTTVAGAGRKVDQWGPYRGFDKTGYMTFVSDAMNCVGFDHGGRYKQEVTSQPGYLFLLRGYFCENGPIADPQARLIEYLESTRVGPKSLQRNALGDQVQPLDVAAWRLAAAPVAPAPATTVVTQQPVMIAPAAGPVVVQQPAVATPVVAVTPAVQAIATRVTWGGVVSQGTTQITPHTGGRSATLAYSALNASFACNGQLVASNGAIGISAPHSGTWQATCSDGETASGTYFTDAMGRGVGRGSDRLGRSIEFAFGG